MLRGKNPAWCEPDRVAYENVYVKAGYNQKIWIFSLLSTQMTQKDTDFHR